MWLLAVGLCGAALAECRVPVFEDRFADSVLFAQRWDFVGASAKNIKFEKGSVKFPGDKGDGIAWKGASTEGCVAEAEIMRGGQREVVRFSPDGSGRIVVGGFESPVEVRRVTVFAKAGRGINLVGNAGFEYDADGVPPGFCNRSQFDAERSSARDYADKYLTCFRVDGNERHSGRQSLRLRVGPFLRSMELFAWGASTEKGKSGVLSVWAKASEPDIAFCLRLGNARKTVKLTTDWMRYEVTTTDLPAPGYFSPVWFEVPDVARRTTEASVWIDDVMFERVDAPEGGFAAERTYSSPFVVKAGDAAVFGPDDTVPAAPSLRGAVQPGARGRAPYGVSPAENALNGFGLPKDGLVLGHYDFYMNEKTAGFRIWNEQGELEEKSVDISNLAPGINEVTVKAFGRDWKASVRKLAYRKGATQINQWSRSLVHEGRPVVMCAPCLIGADVALRADGGATAIDVLAEAGFRYLHLENHPTVANIEKNAKLMDLAAKRGMKFVVWPLEGDLSEAGFIKGADGKASDWSRQRMYGLLDNENVLVQMAMDEPEYRNPDDVRAFMVREKARFPYKPVLMNNTWLGIDGRFAGLPTDILMLVYQLTCEGTTVGEVVSKVDVLRSIAPGKPCWYFLCSENSLHSRVPSYAEQFAQCWGAVTAGASGLSWFVNMPTSKCNFDAMRDVNRELLDQTDFLCSDELCGGAVASADDIRVLTRRRGAEWRIYAVNVTPHPNGEVVLTLPYDIPRNVVAEVLYENRTVEIKGGKIVDDSAPFARHIYRIAEK